MSQTRSILRLNAMSCAVGGGLALIAATPIADALGVSRPGALRLVGAGLLVFAIELTLSAARGRLRRSEVLFFGVADAAWVAGSVVLAAVPGALSPAGRAIVLAVAAVVGWFAMHELRGARSLRAGEV